MAPRSLLLGELIHVHGRRLCRNCSASLLKGIYFKRKHFLPFYSRHLFRKKFVCKKANRKQEKTSLLQTMADNPSSQSSPLANFSINWGEFFLGMLSWHLPIVSSVM